MRKPNKLTEYQCACGNKFSLKRKTTEVPKCHGCHQKEINKRNREKKYYKLEKYRKRQHNWSLKKKYGIDEDYYNHLLEEQNGVCVICKQKDKRHRLVVDHDHETGKVRGLLCHSCNRVLGTLKEDFNLIKSCSFYLMKYKEPVFLSYVPPSWNNWFMKMVYLIAEKSKDKSSKVGAIIVKDNQIVKVGYNGFPVGVNDNIEARHERPLKYSYVSHAEENAILFAARDGVKTDGCILYTNGLCCISCTKAVIQSKIQKVVFHKQFGDIWKKESRQQWDGHEEIAKIMFKESGVELTELNEFLGVETYINGKKFIV